MAATVATDCNWSILRSETAGSAIIAHYSHHQMTIFTMKHTIRTFVWILLLTAISLPSFSQVSLGAKGGLNLSNLSGLGEADFETKVLAGFHVGGYVTFNLGRNFALQPELVYSTQGAQIENATEDLKLNYFNIPVVVKFLTNNGFYVEAGPQLGFQVGTVDNKDFEEDVKNSDFSIVGGIGFQPTKSAFGIGARYNVGLGKAGEINNGSLGNADYRNGVFQLSLYWRLLGGGKLKK